VEPKGEKRLWAWIHIIAFILPHRGTEDTSTNSESFPQAEHESSGNYDQSEVIEEKIKFDNFFVI